MLSGCGESEQEKADYEAIESEAKDFSGPGGLGATESEHARRAVKAVHGEYLVDLRHPAAHEERVLPL